MCKFCQCDDVQLDHLRDTILSHEAVFAAKLQESEHLTVKLQKVIDTISVKCLTMTSFDAHESHFVKVESETDSGQKNELARNDDEIKALKVCAKKVEETIHVEVVKLMCAVVIANAVNSAVAAALAEKCQREKCLTAPLEDVSTSARGEFADEEAKAKTYLSEKDVLLVESNIALKGALKDFEDGKSPKVQKEDKEVDSAAEKDAGCDALPFQTQETFFSHLITNRNFI